MGKIISHKGTEIEKILTKVDNIEEKEVKEQFTFELCSDGFVINDHFVFEVCQGEYAVYPPGIDDKDNNTELDFPSFQYVCNAISFCLGYYNDFMLNTEPDLKEYIDRNGVIE
jgi:hypothetical protein